jgi:hypothetical protein
MKLGPVENYVPQKIYFKAGTNLTFVTDQPNSICNQEITIHEPPPSPPQQTFYGLLGNSSSTVVVYYPNGSTLYYYVKATPGKYGSITVKSPMIIVNKQEWVYGAELAG